MSIFTWLVKRLADYARLCVFALAILLGVQIPGFITQYHQRLDAHLIEAKQNLAGFQFTADRYFEGDIKKLIAHYRASNDKVFIQDASSIQAIYQRVELLTNELEAMQTHPLAQAWHVAVGSDTEVANETWENFAFSVPLTMTALIWGAGLAMIFIILLDSCVFCCRKLFTAKPVKQGMS